MSVEEIQTMGNSDFPHDKDWYSEYNPGWYTKFLVIEYIHTNHLNYDLYDSNDYTKFLIIEYIGFYPGKKN